METKTQISKISHRRNDALLGEKKEKKSRGIKKILVADDDPAIIDVLTLMLEEAGYQVYASANGHTVTDVNKIHPDLILLDILMSGISGHEICKELRNQPSTKHIPVIMISASKDSKEIALNACANDFIAKPFEMDSLLRKVAKFTKSKS
ncbi:MAG: response regulator [Ginsengibacter sp.]